MIERLERRLAPVEDRGHQPLTALEAPEHRALADAGPSGDGVHGHRVHAALADQRVRGDQEGVAVARRVASFLGLVVDERERDRHVWRLATCCDGEQE